MFYRAFYAIRNLSTAKGQPTNAVYGVVAMLRRLIEEEKPDYWAVAMDMHKPTFRHEKYERYKEHRKPMPQELVDQLPWIQQVMEGYRIPIYGVEGFEADDLLGTLAVQGAKAGVQVVVVTGDKDAFQLINDQVSVYRNTKEGHEIFDEALLRERWNVRPNQVVDLMALMGDDVDAIPGVPGVGEKTALNLIHKFESLDRLIKETESDKPEGIKPAVLKSLRENKDQLKISRELAALDTQMKVPFDLESLRRREPDPALLAPLFQELEFRTLSREFQDAGSQPSSSAIKQEPFTAGSLKKNLDAIRKTGRASVVLGLSGGHWSVAQITGIALSWEPGSAVVGEGTSLDAVRPLLEDSSVIKISPDLKVLTGLARREKISLNGFCSDLSLASYLCDPAKPSHQLEDWLADRFSSDDRADETRWRAIQAEGALTLYGDLEKELREKELETLFREVEIPLAGVLARMEEHGIGVDKKEFAVLKKEIDGKLKLLTVEIETLAGGSFNINSPKQLGQILFEKLQLPVIKKTKTGVSTDEEVLRKLSDKHPLPKKILEYRELAKLSSTYVEAIPALVNESTGCVHASFNQAVTTTGRLSSSAPNLQNIPIRNELGRQIRRGFVPRSKDGIFLAADYSQIELRIFAHLSQDPALAEAFRQHQDIHRVTAADIFHIEPEAVTGDQRASAKTINFGILYGMTSFGLSRELGVPVGQAQEFIDRYFERYPAVKRYLDRSLDDTKKRGYCVTLFNRRRYIPELSARVITVRQFAERMAINAPVQGSSADLIKVAMVAIDREIEKQGLSARMVCQVHDELIFDLPAGEKEKTSAVVKSVMEAPEFDGKPFRLSVPLEVNLKSGRNWYEASHD